MNKKGMSTVLMVVVTAVVLLMTALTLMFITQGGLSNFMRSSANQSARNICISNRNAYCDMQSPGGCWDPSQASHQGRPCSNILGTGDNQYYDCEAKVYRKPGDNDDDQIPSNAEDECGAM